MAVSENPLGYRIDREPFEGLLLHDPGQAGGEPVVLYHEYTGIDDNILEKGRDLARQGHMVLVADLYGRKVRFRDPDAAAPYYRDLRNDRFLLRKRAVAAAKALTEHTGGTFTDLSLLGFSLGGAAVLEAAGTPLPVRLAISVYGYLDTPDPARHHRYTCPLLVFHGLKDQVVPMRHLTGFLEKMAAVRASLEVILLSGVGHGFCNPDVVEDRERGNFYHAAVHQRVWQEITTALSRAGAAHNQPMAT